MPSEDRRSSGGASEGSGNDLLADEDALLQCVLDLKEHEVQTYKLLRANPGSTTDELAAKTDRHRVNVNRSLLSLQDAGLVTRRRKLPDIGGYRYQYQAAPIEEVRSQMHRAVNRWVEQAHSSIESFSPRDDEA